MSLEGLEEQVINLARKARTASERVAELSTREKNAWLTRCAERLTDAKAEILAAKWMIDRADEAGTWCAKPSGMGSRYARARGRRSSRHRPRCGLGSTRRAAAAQRTRELYDNSL